MKILSTAVITVICLTACATTPEDINFNSESENALVIFEDKDGIFGGTYTFVGVNTETLSKGEKIRLDKDLSRLESFDKSLAAKGESRNLTDAVFNSAWNSVVKSKKAKTRFSAFSIPVGSYALTQHTYPDFNFTVTSCPEQYSPVYEFKPGVANMILAKDLPDGKSIGLGNYSAGGSDSAVEDIGKILEEYPNLSGRVETVEPTKKVVFEKENGKRDTCGKGKRLVLLD